MVLPCFGPTLNMRVSIVHGSWDFFYYYFYLIILFFTSIKHLASHHPKQELWKRISTAVTCVHFYNQVSLFLLWQWWSKLPRTCVTVVTGLYSCSAVLFEFDEVPVVILQIWPCPQPPRGGNWMMLNVSGYMFSIFHFIFCRPDMTVLVDQAPSLIFWLSFS